MYMYTVTLSKYYEGRNIQAKSYKGRKVSREIHVLYKGIHVLNIKNNYTL